MARLFVAVQPPDDVLDQIEALPRPRSSGVRWTRREHWHVTLRFLGEADVDDTAAALATCDAGPARAVLGPRVARLGREVICLPVSGLDDLAARVGEATASMGEPVDPRPFAGHLTLARLRRRAACGLAGTAFEASFAVEEVRLVSSTLTAAGPIHEVVLARPL